MTSHNFTNEAFDSSMDPGTVQAVSVTGLQGGGGNKRRASSIRGIKGSTLTCHHLSYTVQVPAPRGGGRCAKVDKAILRDVNGIFKPGMNAILGPTGGGKTSMLDVLAGRKNPDRISGTLLVDGHKIPKNFKCMSGYVVQDDVVMGTLTVRENLMFSANLRLPQSISSQEKEERVQDTLQELGLTKCADSKVGNEFIRGVSGGERKRTNIGMELIISPSVLFLDEPTTGLDASTSNAVMTLLRRLSLRGRTIIFSIHQPRYSIYKQFDRLMLLAAGRAVYHGPAQEALQYLSGIGYECEMHNNPPDFFLDVINGDSTAVQQMALHKEKIPIDETSEISGENGDVANGHSNNGVAVVDMDNVQAGKSLAETLADSYRASRWYTNVEQELAPMLASYEERVRNGTEVKLDRGDYANTIGTQLKYVSKRTILNIFRNPQTSVMQWVVTMVFAIVVGLIFLRLDNVLPAALQNRIGVLFFVTVNQMFSNLSAVDVFIKERVIFLHESSSGFYRVSAYFFAKVVCDVIPMRIIPLSFFTIITYFMVGLQEEPGKFFIYYFILFLTSMCATGIGFAISASVRVFAIANLLVSLCYVIMMVFGGLLVNVGKMGAWLNWLQYLSVVRYSLNALSVNELNDIALWNSTIVTTCVANDTDGFSGTYYPSTNLTKFLDYTAGPNYLTQQGIPHTTGWDLWQNMMALGLICIGMMTLTYIQLRRLKTTK